MRHPTPLESMRPDAVKHGFERGPHEARGGASEGSRTLPFRLGFLSPPAFLLSICPGFSPQAGEGRSSVVLAEHPKGVRLLEGPILLHAGIDPQWGGHTFSYLLEGERAVFWSAKRVGPTGPALVGQHPKPGSDREPAVAQLSFGDGRVTRVNQPQMVRTPDGHLHVFIGYGERLGEGETGRIKYYRSGRPEDVSSFVDRTELIPTGEYSEFHTRMNVGLDRDGKRLVLVVLTDFVPNKHSMNVPLAYFGARDGLDFRFQPPIAWAEPTSFFYAQVAATERGPVLVGAVDHDPSRRAELVHLDWTGRVVAWERLPFPEEAAQSWAFEIEPIDPTDWSRLLLVRSIVPREGRKRAIEFWLYDAERRRLELLRSIPNDVSVQPGFSNAGQLLTLAGRPPLFVNEPSSRALYAWEGDLLGEGSMRLAPLSGTEPAKFGYTGIRSLFVPSVLQGSVPSDGTGHVAIDVSNPDLPKESTGPCTFLLWRFDAGRAR